jgi:hemerythrin
VVVKWNDKYMLGIDEIDKQHKHLFEIASEVGGLTKDIGNSIDCYDEYMVILKELIEYTIYHFDYEEKVMKANNYNEDDFIVHQFEHKMFVKKLEKFAEEDFDENQYENINNMLEFLVNWITHHILETDIKYCGVIK